MRIKSFSDIAQKIILVSLILSGCTTIGTDPNPQNIDQIPLDFSEENPLIPATLVTLLAKPRQPGDPILTPTPNLPHSIPPLSSQEDTYIVQSNDTLAKIANRYSVPLSAIIESNGIENPDYLEVGQRLIIPPPDLRPTGPDFKIIPDSELVNGPYNAIFELDSWLNNKESYLSTYTEEIFDQQLSGLEIIQRISNDYSVNPRLLLTILEYRSDWVTGSKEEVNPSGFPIVKDPFREGLYKQLAWLANNLNRGYYLWNINAFSGWVLTDGSVVPVSPTINAGTASVQYVMSLLMNYTDWQTAIGSDGIFNTYSQLFGYPFDYAIEPLIPPDLTQPDLQLPFEKGAVWSFTGGPHGAWGDGSAWAAIDFAPPGEAQGCVISHEWVSAVADGLIVRSDNGAVIQDLDGDGFEQTGWTVLYMHIDGIDRVAKGIYLKAGDRIGHPSCEGGISNGTHVHLARKFNGEWIPADGSVPFDLDGWVSSGIGVEYDGYLTRNGQQVEAFDGNNPINQIQR